MEIFEHFLAGAPKFALYFLVGVLLLILFLIIYLRVTPHREIALIRSGNVAAALSLSGTMLGFAIPLAHAVAQSVSLLDMLLWGTIAMVVQLLVFLVVSRIIPETSRDIAEGKVAQGAFLGALSLATGILNAASMTY